MSGSIFVTVVDYTVTSYHQTFAKAADVADKTGASVARYIPSPTWRPIAGLPKEWRDGRDVLVRLSGYRPLVAHWTGRGWMSEHAGAIRPELFLDLAIPEVPRA